MRRPTQQTWLAVIFITLLFAIFSDSYPSGSKASLGKISNRRNIKRGLLLPRTDDPFLGDDWVIVTMENHAAYVPHANAARDLEDFYTSLQTVALHPVVGPGHYFIHRINRVLIIFHCTGINIPVELILRFANGMLGFTRMGFTSAYRMQFRHEISGVVLTVTLSVDEPPPPGNPDCTVPLEEHGEVNASGGIRQVCILGPPSFPSS